MHEHIIRLRMPFVENHPIMGGAEALAIAFNLATAAGFQGVKYDFRMGGTRENHYIKGPVRVYSGETAQQYGGADKIPVELKPDISITKIRRRQFQVLLGESIEPSILEGLEKRMEKWGGSSQNKQEVIGSQFDIDANVEQGSLIDRLKSMFR